MSAMKPWSSAAAVYQKELEDERINKDMASFGIQVKSKRVMKKKVLKKKSLQNSTLKLGYKQNFQTCNLSNGKDSAKKCKGQQISSEKQNSVILKRNIKNGSVSPQNKVLNKTQLAKKTKKNKKKFSKNLGTLDKFPVASHQTKDIAKDKISTKEVKHAATEEESEDSEISEPLNTSNSREEGRTAFQWVIHPTPLDQFYNKHWEEEPLLIKRNNSKYYKGIFSTSALDTILRQQNVQYTKNVDITSYSNGKRETHNPVGRAMAPVVWDYFSNGCSIRMLNPQTFHKAVWKLLATLQEHFNSFVGANVYLTPAGTQGFAPHWDDIEAFILQLEGRKRWRVYRPPTKAQQLPRYSSKNFDQNEIGEPILDTILEAGDLLYFPRGFIHQGHTLDEEHSLHITLSTYQKHSWGDFFEVLLPQALSVAIEEDVEFRRGIPRDLFQFVGIASAEQTTLSRRKLLAKVGEMMQRLSQYTPIDAAADQFALKMTHDSLPPFLTAEDKQCSVYGNGERWCEDSEDVVDRVELAPDTEVRLIRAGCIRLVAEEEVVRVYHTVENSREYHAEELQFVEVQTEHAPAVENLLHAYPAYLAIQDLPLPTLEEKMAVAGGLYERGLLVTAMPLLPAYD